MNTTPINSDPLQSQPKLNMLAQAIRMSVIGLALAHGSAQAASIEVSSLGDPGTDSDGLCTLREAVTSLNDGDVGLTGCVMNGEAPGANDLITLAEALNPASSSIILSGSKIDVLPDSDITVEGAGITLDADGASRVLTVINADLSLNNISLVGGSETLGGAILAQTSANVVLTNCSVSGNTATSQGGAINLSNSSSISLTNCVVSDNSAALGGGAIHAPFTVSVNLVNSTVSGNSSATDGGGIFARDGAIVTLNNSKLIGNSAADQGGGMVVSAATANVTNSTVSNNLAVDDGGGIFAVLENTELTLVETTVSANSAGSGGGIDARESAEIDLVNSTISNNSAGAGGGLVIRNSSLANILNSTITANSSPFGGGVYTRNSAVINLNNTIVSGNISERGAEVRENGGTSTVTTDGNNLFGHSGLTIADAFAGSIVLGASDIIASSDSAGMGTHIPTKLPAILQSLSSNGGATRTHALASSSPARNTAKLNDPNGCPVADQRGQVRNDGDGFCDIGAVEFNRNDGSNFLVIPLSGKSAVVIPN